MDDLDLCSEVVSRSCQPLRYIRRWYCRWISWKPLEIEAWFQRTTNRKWHMGYQMVTWSMTSRDPQRCCEAVRSAIVATAWLLLMNVTILNKYWTSRESKRLKEPIERIQLISARCWHSVPTSTVCKLLATCWRIVCKKSCEQVADFYPTRLFISAYRKNNPDLWLTSWNLTVILSATSWRKHGRTGG